MTSLIREAGALLRDAALGALLGLLFLGIGGRIAMRAVAITLGQPPVLDSGGTMTVIAAGTAAGAAGALLYAISRSASGLLVRWQLVRSAQGGAWARALRLTLFAALLALVTARGLRGSPGPTWLFWLLVAAYGTALEVALVRRAREVRRLAAQPGSLQTS
jgi:hypothetical protein